MANCIVNNLKEVKRIKDCKTIILTADDSEVLKVLKGKKNDNIGNIIIEYDRKDNSNNDNITRTIYSYEGSNSKFHQFNENTVLNKHVLQLYKSINIYNLSSTLICELTVINSKNLLLLDNISSTLPIKNYYGDRNPYTNEYIISLEFLNEITNNITFNITFDILDYYGTKITTHEMQVNIYINSETPGEF